MTENQVLLLLAGIAIGSTPLWLFHWSRKKKRNKKMTQRDKEDERFFQTH